MQEVKSSAVYKFSFLMCVNRWTPFLDKALESMLCQAYDAPYGIVVVANNCEDALWDHLNVFNIQHGNRMSIYRTGVGQLSYNLNYGIDKAECEYIVRMDADDVATSQRLRITADLLKEYGEPDVLCGGAEIIDESGSTTGCLAGSYNAAKVRRWMPFRNVLIHPACAIRREALYAIGGYLGGRHGQDYELWVRMLRHGLSLVRHDQIVLSYRISDYQSRGSRIAYAEGVAVRVREMLLRRSPLYAMGASLALLKFVVFSLSGRAVDKSHSGVTARAE